MKTKTALFFTLFVIVLLHSSCVHYYYAPSANNVPLFKEKNEARIQAQFSSGNAFTGFDIQSAYAISQHAGLQLNIFHAGQTDNEYGSGNGTYAEFAGGYFKPLVNKKWVFETYGGFGTGSVKNIYINPINLTQENSKISITKFFIQPSFGFTSNYFDAAFSSKFSMVTAGVKNSTLTKENNEYDYNQVLALKDKSYFFWEPGLMIRGGFKKVKVLLQVTYSIGNKTQLAVDDTNLSLGIILPFKVRQTLKQ